jgi:hypothetical protein
VAARQPLSGGIKHLTSWNFLADFSRSRLFGVTPLFCYWKAIDSSRDFEDHRERKADSGSERRFGFVVPVTATGL